MDLFPARASSRVLMLTKIIDKLQNNGQIKLIKENAALKKVRKIYLLQTSNCCAVFKQRFDAMYHCRAINKKNDQLRYCLKDIHEHT